MIELSFKNYGWFKMSCVKLTIILPTFLAQGMKVDFERKIQQEFLGLFLFY